MENVETKKPQEGAWNKMMTDEERKPKVKFEFDQTQVIVMQCDEPREIEWEDSVFYVFDVMHNGEEKVITTSAWSLLRDLKCFEPLKGKTLKITKRMIKNKQTYVVEANTESV